MSDGGFARVPVDPLVVGADINVVVHRDTRRPLVMSRVRLAVRIVHVWGRRQSLLLSALQLAVTRWRHWLCARGRFLPSEVIWRGYGPPGTVVDWGCWV